MQQRLVEIGKWLRINGEAIYDTRAFIRNSTDKSINPAANEKIFFTKKNKDLYVICTVWPKNNIVLKGLNSTGSQKVQLLGSASPVSMKSSGGDTVIVPPRLTPDECQSAYVFKVSNILK
jgi:alpha-L-fucosidase